MEKDKGSLPKTKEEAQKRADELCEILKNTVGGEWITRVWFNAIWYCYDVKLGTMSVQKQTDNTFGCLISDKLGDETFGAGDWLNYKHSFSTPKEAVEAAIKESKEVSDRMVYTVSKNQNLISGKKTFTKVKNKLRVCHFAQVPCKPFVVEVADEYEAKKMVDTLAQQHLFLYKNKIIPDYANMIGVEMWEDNFDGEGNGSWVHYWNENEGMEFSEIEKIYM